MKMDTTPLKLCAINTATMADIVYNLVLHTIQRSENVIEEYKDIGYPLTPGYAGFIISIECYSKNI